MSIDYKYKPDKHKYRVNLKSLDEIHKEQINDFEKKHESLPEKRVRLNVLEKELFDMENCKEHMSNINFEIMKKKIILRNSIKTLKEEINKTENFNSELDYYSRTGDVLCNYYDITNGLMYGKNEVKDDDINKENNNSKIVISNELLEITNMDRKRKLKKPVRKRGNKIEPEMVTNNILSFLLGTDADKPIEEDSTVCKATLQNQYLLMMDKEYACSKSKTMPIKKCKKCNIDKIIIHNEAILSCPKCGESEDTFIESDVPSQRDTFTEKPKYPYKKIGHCVEKLNQFLCKGTTNVPQSVFTTLHDEIIKRGKTKDEITTKFLEAMLKKHRLSDYYENIMYIHSKITGTRPQTITHDEHQLVLKMFSEAEKVFEEKYKPNGRNNFLKYTFVLNKIFLTIGRSDISQHFKLLKSVDKLKQQERIWSKICGDLGWTYHAS